MVVEITRKDYKLYNGRHVLYKNDIQKLEFKGIIHIYPCGSLFILNDSAVGYCVDFYMYKKYKKYYTKNVGKVNLHMKYITFLDDTIDKEWWFSN